MGNIFSFRLTFRVKKLVNAAGSIDMKGYNG